MIKRILDILFSFFGLIILFPLFIIVSFCVWKQDFRSPFYFGERVKRNNKTFKLFKFRSMVIDADKLGGDSTSSSDSRITPFGKFIRKYKIDELPQLFNVLIGDMSIVGPRPQTIAGVNFYTTEEQLLLTVKPGITDIASIVFSDEGDIINNYPDPDKAYNEIIRPWKSKLGILYIKNNNIFVDFIIVANTVIALFNKPLALKISKILVSSLTNESDLIETSGRTKPL